MAFVPIPMPTKPLSLSKPIPVSSGDAIFIYFEEQVTYTEVEDPKSSPPVAFSPALPFGTFFNGDYIGPFVAGNSKVVVTITYYVGSSTDKNTLVIAVN
jgi:hypothetical protein